MDEILRELSNAYTAISSISVSGDAVDVMASARMRLRNVYAKLNEINKSNTPDAEKEV